MPVAFAATEARHGGGPPGLLPRPSALGTRGSLRAGCAALRRPLFGTSLACASLLLVAPPAWASEGGLVLVPDPGMLAALLVFFVVLVYPVNVLLLRPLLRVLDARESRITGTRQRADKISADADEILARYEEAVRDVREEAERDRKQRLLAARSESAAQTATARSAAEQDIDRARQEIAAELAAARQSLGPHVEALAREAATRVIGRSLS